MKVKHRHLSCAHGMSPPNCTNGPLVRYRSLAKSDRLVCMRQRVLISTCVLWAAGQADTYEIFPLLTLATASAGEINHALTHAQRSSNNTSNNPALLGMIIASFDLFQLHFNKWQFQGRFCNEKRNIAVYEFSEMDAWPLTYLKGWLEWTFRNSRIGGQKDVTTSSY